MRISSQYNVSAQSDARNFRSTVIDRAQGQDFDDFYALYQTIFTLQEERESPEGFAEVMGMNTNADVQAQYGPYKEVVMVLRDPETNQVVAGANFIMMPRGSDKSREDWGGLDAVVQSNYIFVHPDFREHRLASRLLSDIEAATRDFTRKSQGDNAPSEVRVAQFFEQNDPQKMTLDEYASDNANAGIDQYDRLMAFQKMGARRVDFDYVQPALEKGGEPCEYLMLTARNPEGTEITPTVMQRYLEGFLSVSVMKCRDGADQDPNYRAMMDELNARGTQPIATYDDRATIPAQQQAIHFVRTLGVESVRPIGDLLIPQSEGPA